MLHIKRYSLFVALLLASNVFCPGQEEELRRTVAFLADSVGNRYPASNGDMVVRSRIAQEFASYGLECETQDFDVVEYMWGDGKLLLQKDNTVTHFNYGTDFVVASRSAADTLSSEYVVVLGALPDSLLGLMRDKVVVALLRSDRGKIPQISEMIQAGARAIIYVQPPEFKVKETISKGNRISQSRTIPVLYVNNEELSVFITQSTADSLSGHIFVAPPSYKIQIATRHYEKHLQAANIIGVKRGQGEKYIVVGAHYDTLAPDPENGETRRGANDNASGVAIMMSLAKRLSVTETRHNIFFVAFGGEEKGCLGSMHFVAQMPFEKDDLDEMINLDMLGRMEQRVLYFNQTNEPQIKPTDLRPTTLVLAEGDDSLSDYYDFFKAGIATSYFHTGKDLFMHSPEDSSDRLNYDGMADILDFLADYILAIDAENALTLHPTASVLSSRLQGFPFCRYNMDRRQSYHIRKDSPQFGG